MDSEKTKERRTTGRNPQGICYWGYQEETQRNLVYNQKEEISYTLK